MAGWLKAGLIGALIVIVLNLLGLIPVLACFVLPLTWIAYLVIGVLAAAWMRGERTVGSAAGQGALAGLLASVIGGIVSWIIAVAQAALGGTARLLSQIPPEVLEMLRQSGIPPQMVFGVGGMAVFGLICCVVGLVIAVLLSTIGAMIYAALKK